MLTVVGILTTEFVGAASDYAQVLAVARHNAAGVTSVIRACFLLSFVVCAMRETKGSRFLQSRFAATRRNQMVSSLKEFPAVLELARQLVEGRQLQTGFGLFLAELDTKDMNGWFLTLCGHLGNVNE